MNFSIAVVAYRRPAYLSQALTAISNLDGFDSRVEHVLVSVDDADGLGKDSAAVAKEWVSRLNVPISGVCHQPTRRGIVGNSVLALKAAFDAGAENVLYVEDDAVLSRDALKVCEWMLQQSPGRYLAYGLSRGSHPEKDNLPGLFSETHVHPCPYAWCIRREEWPFVLHHWCRKTYTPVGWSFAMTYNARMHGKARFLAPHLARVKYIGRDDGTNGSWREFLTLDQIPASDGTYSDSYGIVDLVSDDKARAVDDWMLSEVNKEPRMLTDGWLGFGRPKELDE